MGNLDENGNLNVNIEKESNKRYPAHWHLLCGRGHRPLSECVRDARLYEMVTVSENSISLHGYFFWKY